MEKKNYLDIARASDIANLKERRIYRFFELIPGIMSLGTLLGVLVFSWLLPVWVAIFIILFCFYYLFRVFYLSIHQVISYLRMRRHLRVNWLSLLAKEIRDWQKIYHLIILPSYKEKPEIIKESLDSLIQSDYPKENLIMVLSVEERAGKEFLEAARVLEKEYSEKFYRFLVTVHPQDTPGEIAGKGSNVAYAGKTAKEKIIDILRIPYENILVSSFDIDTKIYPQYLSCLTWHYLKEKNPLRTSYQPVPVYNNNIWEAPAFSRLVSTSNTFWQMMQQERPEKLVTYSSHSLPFKTFVEVGYPSNLVPDDSRMFWKAYLYYDGDYKVLPLYYPVSMDAVRAKNLFWTIINQYRQQRRWAWGCSEIPYLMYGFLKNKKISFREKMSHLYNILDGFWSWSTTALLIFFFGWLPILLGGERFNLTLLSFNLPRLISQIMTVALVGMIVSAILSMLILPSLPRSQSRLKYLSILLQWIFLPITLIVFGSFPALDAQIRLMLGRYMGFWVTEKVRKKF